MGYHVYLWHGTSVCWYIKTQLESGPFTADLTTTVALSYKLLIKDVKSILSRHMHTYTHKLISSSIMCKMNNTTQEFG